MLTLVLAIVDGLFALMFTIIMLWMFFSGNYLASLAACAIATHFEWAFIRRTKHD